MRKRKRKTPLTKEQYLAKYPNANLPLMEGVQHSAPLRITNKVGRIEGRPVYPEKKKRDAIRQWLILGNLVEVAKSVHVPYKTLEAWKENDWWYEIAAEIKATKNIEINAKVEKNIERALNELHDRLQSGDFQYDTKQGKLIRKPINARDLNRIVETQSNLREVLTKNNDEKAKELSFNQKLESIASAFQRFANAKEISVEKESIKEIEADLLEEKSTE